MVRAAFALAVATLLASGAHCVRLREALRLPCGAYDFGLPSGVAPPPHPPDVCLTPERVELGRRLFFDRRLSGNQTQSCSSCHELARAFTDGRARAVGSTGQTHPRNAQGLANIGYVAPLTWINPELRRLDNQTLIPFFSENTATTVEELAISGQEHTVAARLTAIPEYVSLFRLSFPGHPVNITTVARALAAFQATLVSFRSPFDRGDLNPAAVRGKALFFSRQAGCAACHAGPLFQWEAGTNTIGYHNIGLYNVGGRGDYPDHKLHPVARAERRSQGLHLVTGRPQDRGRFRTPSLRNLRFTAPYMHDGSVQTLAGVVEILSEGGRVIRSGPFAGDGRTNPNKDSRIRPLGLSSEQKADLVAFLESLSDDCFTQDPRYADPTGPAPRLPAHCRGPANRERPVAPPTTPG